MKNCRHRISQVKEGSIAWELEVEPGDELLSINGETIEAVSYTHLLSVQTRPIPPTSVWLRRKTRGKGY